MYGVAWFARLLDEINSLQLDNSWEQDYEGDNSDMPAKLKAWLKDGAALLQAMCAEECGELVEGDEIAFLSKIKPDSVLKSYAGWTSDKADEINKKFTGLKPEEIVTLRKTLKLTPTLLTTAIAKAGARHSKADMDRLQAIHDHSVGMGAACGDDADKSIKTEDVAKVQSAIDDAVAKAMAPLQETITKLTTEKGEMETRIKTLENTGKFHDPNITLRVIDKSADLGGGDNNDPLTKLAQEIAGTAKNGVVDQGEVALAVTKFIHRNGGKQLG